MCVSSEKMKPSSKKRKQNRKEWKSNKELYFFVNMWRGRAKRAERQNRIQILLLYTCGCPWLKSEENEEARRLLFNPEEPRICFFRAREEPQKIWKPSEVRGKFKRKRWNPRSSGFLCIKQRGGIIVIKMNYVFRSPVSVKKYTEQWLSCQANVKWFCGFRFWRYELLYKITKGKQTARFLIGRHQGQKWWGSRDATPFKLK